MEKNNLNKTIQFGNWIEKKNMVKNFIKKEWKFVLLKMWEFALVITFIALLGEISGVPNTFLNIGITGYEKGLGEILKENLGLLLLLAYLTSTFQSFAIAPLFMKYPKMYEALCKIHFIKYFVKFFVGGAIKNVKESEEFSKGKENIKLSLIIYLLGPLLVNFLLCGITFLVVVKLYLLTNNLYSILFSLVVCLVVIILLIQQYPKIITSIKNQILQIEEEYQKMTVFTLLLFVAFVLAMIKQLVTFIF